MFDNLREKETVSYLKKWNGQITKKEIQNMVFKPAFMKVLKSCYVTLFKITN